MNEYRLNPPIRPASAAEMRELDRRAIEDYGIPGIVLMENAGRGAAELALRRWPAEASGPVAVFCGAGNNGGDGFVLAWHLARAGREVRIVLAGSPERIRADSDARTAFDSVLRLGLPVLEAPAGGGTIDPWIGRPALAVDALLGTGSSGPPRGLIADCIRSMTRSGAPILALDIPSGLDPDTGEAPGECLSAAVTAAFGLPKPGYFIGEGPRRTGEVEIIDIGLPAELLRPYGI